MNSSTSLSPALYTHLEKCLRNKTAIENKSDFQLFPLTYLEHLIWDH